MKRKILCIGALLISFALFAGCGTKKTTQPDETGNNGSHVIKDLSFFGTTPKEAAQMLGIELKKIPAEESAFSDMGFAFESYSPAENYKICGYPANMELGFITEKTPEDTEIGLGFFNIILPEDTQPDLGKIVDFLTETYGVNPAEGIEKDGKLVLFNYTTENQKENGAVTSLNYTISNPNTAKTEDNTLWLETCKGLFGNFLDNIYLYMEGSVYPSGEVHIYGDARNTAVWNHLEDYKE